MVASQLPKIMPGQRASIAGRSGSGKSTLARWLLIRSPGRWLILNPKHTRAYSALPDSNVVNGIDFKKIEKSFEDFRFTIVNPTPAQSSPDNMDDFIHYMHMHYQNVGICIDELYTLHKNGQAGQGLLGLLTRGRELNQSYLGLTQRPVWVSQFVFSESSYVGEMSLNLAGDRKRMFENTGHIAMLEKLPPHYWLWYDMDKDLIKKYGPVPAK